MGRRQEQAFLQRGHPDGQQLFEKMFIITFHQRNANQNCMILHLSEWLLTTQGTTGIGDYVEKKEHSCNVGGNANWCGHSGKQYGGS